MDVTDLRCLVGLNSPHQDSLYRLQPSKPQGLNNTHIHTFLFVFNTLLFLHPVFIIIHVCGPLSFIWPQPLCGFSLTFRVKTLTHHRHRHHVNKCVYSICMFEYIGDYCHVVKSDAHIFVSKYNTYTRVGGWVDYDKQLENIYIQ